MKTVNKTNLPTIDYRKLVSLQDDLKELTDSNYQRLLNSIKEEGFFIPAFVWFDGETPYIVDAHQRQRVLVGEDIQFENSGYEIPYVEIEAQDKQEAARKLLKISSQYGTISKETLDEFIVRHGLSPQETYEATYFDAIQPYASEEDEIEEDVAPEVEEETEPISKPGEVYQLGRHRLMCGSATSEEDVAKLMQDARINTIHTDPPYGVEYKSKKLGGIMNDDLKDDSLYNFIYDAFDIASKYLEQDAAIYCWYEDRYRHTFQTALENAGLEFKQNLIWNKGMNLSGADYQKAHENVLYCQVKDGKAKWNGERDKKTILGQKRTDLMEMKKQDLIAMLVAIQSQATVWDIDRDTVTTYVHPTQKPVTLSGRAILNSTDDGDNVYDGFAGSGSTLIACEQTNRTCYAMELDPKYADVIRKRYAKFIQPDNQLPENWEEITPAISGEKQAE